MKTWRQRLAILLLFPALLAYLPLTAQAHSFTDVSGSAYRDAINYVYDNGIMDGVTTTAFAPGNAVNRAMFVTILYRFAGEPKTSGTISFTDVPEGRYFTDAVRWGTKEGIISGTSATTFSPYNTLQKQQVVTFLYRFAQYRGYSVPTSGSLTCSDASKISNYAKVPMYWAVQNGILEDVSVQNPTKGSTRGEAAWYICRFGTNVDGLLKGVDTFSFTNDCTSFKFQDYYAISTSHYNLLMNNAGADSSDLEYYLSLKPSIFPISNGGACYGMSLCAILDKLGKIDFNRSFCNNVSTMYQIPKPTDQSAKTIWQTEKKNGSSISLTESAINYYQAASIAVWTIGTSYKNRGAIGTTYGRDILSDLVDGQRYGGFGLFCYSTVTVSGDDFSHAIAIYGQPRVGVSSYVYNAYDSRYPNNIATVTVAKDFSECSVLPAAGKRETVTEVYYFNEFSAYDVVDIDGPRNAESNTVRSMDANDEISASPEEVDAEPSILDGGYTVLYIDTDSDFTVTNAEGETLEFTDHTYSGTMWAQYLRMIPMGSHALRMILVEDSAQFHFTTAGSCQYLGITSQTLSQGVSGVSIDQVTLGADGFRVAGTDMTYYLTHTLAAENGNYCVQITGSGESQITVSPVAEGLEVQTEQAAYTVEFSKSGEILGMEATSYQADEIARITEEETGISTAIVPKAEVAQ